jgi:hypothetical protein
MTTNHYYYYINMELSYENDKIEAKDHNYHNKNHKGA